MQPRTGGVGKRVGTSLYVHRDAAFHIDASLIALLQEALAALPQAAKSWNVARLSLTEREVAFLDYPLFESDPFPTLATSWLVRLGAELQVNFRDFQSSLNPPILHRKELLLTPDDDRRPKWSELTADAEAIGLFADASRIGFRRDWLAKIAESGYELHGDGFVPMANCSNEGSDAAEDAVANAIVARHRTALTRSTFSAPVQALLRFGLLRDTWSIFDYGCGKGHDIDGLTREGFIAHGWDPHFAPGAQKLPSDVVNLGFVLNVIEDRGERDQTLKEAFGLAGKVLSIAVMTQSAAGKPGLPFRDGFLTSRETFQKYFSQSEFKTYIEMTLDRPVTLVAPGVAFVFADDEFEEEFRLNRQRSSRVWVRAALTRSAAPRVRAKVPFATALYDANLHDFTRLWDCILQNGRTPIDGEAEDFTALINLVGSLSKAVRICMQNNDPIALESARRERIDDLKVYFALQAFHKRTTLKALNPSLQQDVKSFFGSLGAAQSAGSDLLSMIASPAAIQEACETAAREGLGHYFFGHSLQIHTSLVEALPIVLRVYIEAAATIYGDVRSADLVKLHIRSGKLTVLEYKDFDSSPTPLLQRRIKIRLRTQEIDVFEYEGQYEPTILLGKSRFVNEEYPDYARQVAFDEQLLPFCQDFPEHGPTASQLNEVLRFERLAVTGFELRPAETIPDLADRCGTWLTYRDLIQCGETVHATKCENMPQSPHSFNALRALVKHVLDPIIEYFGGVEITFGFCSPDLARAIRRRRVGRIAPQLDQHAASEYNASGHPICDRGGAAVDFLVPDENMYEVAKWITENLPYDRLYIYGPSRPLHVSYGPQQSKQTVFVDRSDGKVRPRRVTNFAELPG
jgi:DNA phosphorothioation-associated putative methyltransferase